MDLEDMLSRATAELESAETELRAAQQRVEELQTIKQGIQLAIQRYGYTVSPPTPGPADDDVAPVSGSGGGDSGVLNGPSTASPGRVASNAKSDVTQSDLITEALKELRRPATSAEIRQRLKQRGHELNAEQARGTLAYLLRKERVVRTATGVWALPEYATTAGNGFSLRTVADRNY